MTPNQYKTTIKALGLSQVRAGVFLGIAPRTSQGYALGEYPVPPPTATLLTLMAELQLKPDDVTYLTSPEAKRAALRRAKGEPMTLEQFKAWLHNGKN